MGAPLLAAPAGRGTVLIHDPRTAAPVRPRLAEQIRATERLGYEVAAVHGPEAGPQDRAGFHAAYTQTMERRGATRYLFSAEYMAGSSCSSAPGWSSRDRPPTARRRGRSPQSPTANSTTSSAARRTSRWTTRPSNASSAMLDLADELRVPLNLGGGVEAGDGLERFKRGFANSSATFETHETSATRGVRGTQRRSQAGQVLPGLPRPA